MPTLSRVMTRVVWTSAVTLTAAIAFHSAAPEGDPSVSVAVAQSPFGDGKPQYQGLRSCVPCHNEVVSDDNPFVTMTREFCALNEVRVFTGDKHRQAYELLNGELGKHMEKILAQARNDSAYKVTEDKQCLSCHANWHWKEGEDQPPLIEFGVGCESCHGPSSLWEGPHDDPRWRTLSAQEKEEKYGFIDVRNPIRRASQCFSCHIGNVQEGKVVTHEMYAAGHPPLPGIEIESFATQMPVHWRNVQEKGLFKFQSEYIKANFPDVKHDPLKDLARTRSVIIGGVMALREAANLLASQSIDNDSKDWPELAVFDCSACHHDLAAPSWRQKRGYGRSLPGRPQMFAWPEALVKLGIRQRAGSDDAEFKSQWDAYHGKMEELRRVLDRRPFGEPEAINAVVSGEDGVLAWLDQLAVDIFNNPVTEEDAGRAIQTLLTLGPDDYPDFHSARQIIWALHSIQTELSSDVPEFLPPVDGETEKQSIDRALANLKRYEDWLSGDRAAAGKKVTEDLGRFELTQPLRTELPAGVNYVIAEQLPESLKAIGSYDPEWFRAQLQTLARSLASGN